jgi:hypothetical protein
MKLPPIQRGIRIPAVQRRQSRGFPARRVYESLKTGECVTLNGTKRQAYQRASAIRNAALALGGAVTQRRVGPSSVRVWRVR